ncbi:helix-turn-helix domain-containing protein [uncultured Sphingomonas sp.]|uniref:helix-turn-helix domain-containing protein n=1 Tax=uncultured Sphingomonas sp. TaxID=158754 RepID=UPI00374A3969
MARQRARTAQLRPLRRAEPAADGPPVALNSQVAEFEAGLICAKLIRHAGDIPETLAHLQIARNTLYDKLKKSGIRLVNYRVQVQAQRPMTHPARPLAQPE